MSREGGVGHNLPCSPQGPRGVQVLEERQIAAHHLLSCTDDKLQSALVLGSDSRVPDGDGRGEDGPSLSVAGLTSPDAAGSISTVVLSL